MPFTRVYVKHIYLHFTDVLLAGSRPQRVDLCLQLYVVIFLHTRVANLASGQQFRTTTVLQPENVYKKLQF